MSGSLPTKTISMSVPRHPQHLPIDYRPKSVPTIPRLGHDRFCTTPSSSCSMEGECHSLTPPPLRRHSSDPSSRSTSDPSRFLVSEKMPLSNILSLPYMMRSIESDEGVPTASRDSRTAAVHLKLPSIKLRPKRSAIRRDVDLSFGE